MKNFYKALSLILALIIILIVILGIYNRKHIVEEVVQDDVFLQEIGEPVEENQKSSVNENELFPEHDQVIGEYIDNIRGFTINFDQIAMQVYSNYRQGPDVGGNEISQSELRFSGSVEGVINTITIHKLR